MDGHILVNTCQKDLAARRLHSADAFCVSTAVRRVSETRKQNRQKGDIKLCAKGLWTGLVDYVTALQCCNYTRRPCAHESSVLLVSAGVFKFKKLLIFQKNVLLRPGGPVGMDVSIDPLDNKLYNFRVVGRSLSCQSG